MNVRKKISISLKKSSKRNIHIISLISIGSRILAKVTVQID